MDWVLEMLAITSLVAIFVVVLANWASLPAQVPLHFDAAGRPNGWGSKTGLVPLPFIAAAIYALLTFAGRNPRLVNLPFKIDRNAPQVQSLLLRMSINLKLVLLWVFFYIVLGIVHTASGRSEGLGKVLLPASLVVILLLPCYYFVKLRPFRQ